MQWASSTRLAGRGLRQEMTSFPTNPTLCDFRSWWLTPCYYALTFQSLLMVMIGLLLTDRSRRIRQVLSGILFGVGGRCFFMAKPTTAGKRVPVLGDGTNGFLGGGTNRFQLLEVRDLADAVYLAASNGCDKGVHIGAAKLATVKKLSGLLDYAATVSRILHVPSRRVKTPLAVLKSLRLSNVYRRVYETVDHDSFVSIDKLKQDLGWSSISAVAGRLSARAASIMSAAKRWPNSPEHATVLRGNRLRRDC